VQYIYMYRHLGLYKHVDYSGTPLLIPTWNWLKCGLKRGVVSYEYLITLQSVCRHISEPKTTRHIIVLSTGISSRARISMSSFQELSDPDYCAGSYSGPGSRF
jgi:hypothetical protein